MGNQQGSFVWPCCGRVLLVQVLGAPWGDLGGTSSILIVTGVVGAKALERLHEGILLQNQKLNA